MGRLERRGICCLILWVVGIFVCLRFNYPNAFSSKFQPREINEPIRFSNRNHRRGVKSWSLTNDTVPRVATWNRSVSNFNNSAVEEAYYKLRKTKVNKLNAMFLIENRDFCLKTTPYLLVAVPSVSAHTTTRKAIRETYGTHIPNKNSSAQTSRVVFFFGRGATDEIDERLREESNTYGDIVQADFIDSYRNLTLKMMVILKWVAEYCGEIDYLLKADEDVFVNIPLLTSKLNKTSYNFHGLVIGFQNEGAPVKRKGKWGVSKDQFPFPTYPTYHSGNSYVISGNIVPRMFVASQYIPYMPIEDVFVTGILAKMVGAEHLNMEGFTYWLEQSPNPCRFVRNKRLTATKVGSELMRSLWKSVINHGKHCTRTKEPAL